MKKSENTPFIEIKSFTFFPRSKTYDVVWKRVEDTLFKVDHISEELLTYHIQESGLNKVTNYSNTSRLNPLRFLETNAGEVLYHYLNIYYKKP